MCAGKPVHNVKINVRLYKAEHYFLLSGSGIFTKSARKTPSAALTCAVIGISAAKWRWFFIFLSNGKTEMGFYTVQKC